MIPVIFAAIVTLVIVSPVAGFIVVYKYLYPDRPLVGSNKVYKVGVEPQILVFEEVEINWNIEESQDTL
jgi:hypothetical protein